MTLGLRLDLRQSQGLVLTPQLQQAIKLLQLSNLELAGAVQKEITDNPFLEAKSSEAAAPARPERERELDGSVSMRRADDGADEGWSQAPAEAAADRRLRVSKSANGFDEMAGSAEERMVRGATLNEHLRGQLMSDRHSQGTEALAQRLVDWLAEDGYLRESDEELAAALCVPVEQVGEARALVLRCEPVGCGARDLAQCLGAQLAELDRLDPAMQTFLANLPAVARADFATLQRVCGLDLDDIRDMVGEIKRLDPRPGLSFNPPEPIDVVPDLLVYRGAQGQWRIELNQATLPKVLVNRGYYSEVTKLPLERRDREFMSERFQAASWLSKALDQRARTILRVGRAIFVRQRGFLEHGACALQPLVLRVIAEATGLHESTISRATADKYALTPRGTFPLRYFFSTGLAAADGAGMHSAEAIRQRIRGLIEGEDPVQVLSDDQIVSVLKDSGIAIARRTVAKYRESLGIASSVQRRRSKALSL